jgi:hypothetical protein
MTLNVLVCLVCGLACLACTLGLLFTSNRMLQEVNKVRPTLPPRSAWYEACAIWEYRRYRPRGRLLFRFALLWCVQGLSMGAVMWSLGFPAIDIGLVGLGSVVVFALLWNPAGR